MIAAVVRQWDERKGALAKWLATAHPESYATLVERLVALVLTEPIGGEWGRPLDPKRIHRIDDGDYQGTEIYLIAADGYQPGAEDYVWLDNSYGSCSGCDTLESIRNYDDAPPTEEQIADYMTLALHMIQRMKWLVPTTEAA